MHEKFINLADILVGKYVYITCIHGDTWPYPIRLLSLTIEGQEGHIRAVVVGQDLPVNGQTNTVCMMSTEKSG